MLPRIRYDLKNSFNSEWHVDANITSDVKFFQTNLGQQFDEEFETMKKDGEQKVYYTLSFIYTIKQLN